MQAPAKEGRYVRFGPFEVDLHLGELRANGHKANLQEQPFQILAILLEQPGELVTREEFRQRLWPTNTFVDFEHSINTAVRKLREALGDDADSPRFVETLPRRGYRFIYPVKPVGGLSSSPISSAAGTPPLQGVRAVREAPLLRKRWVIAVAGSALAVAAMVVGVNVAGLRDRLLTAVGARPAVSTPKIQSIAVLPLENLSRDPEQEYFADGMTDALITDLGKVSALRVISRQSMMRYKRTRKPLPEIAQELNADAVLEGTVQRSEGRVRITAQLLDARTDRHLWANAYERDLRDILALQSDVARAIAAEVKAKITPDEQARFARARPVNREAYELYLRGRYQLDGWRDVPKAYQSFTQAIERDPTFAPAYAGLAGCAITGGAPPDVLAKARDAADKALELDPMLAQAHGMSAFLKVFEWDWAGAERESKRALELNPSDADAHGSHATFLAATGRFDEAIAEMEQAHELDPAGLSSNLALGWVYTKARRYDDAIAQFRRTLDLNPNLALTRHELAWAYTFKGKYEEALAEYQKLGLPTDSMLAYLYAVSGRRAEALKMIRDLERRGLERQRRGEYTSSYHMAIPYAGLNDKEKALALLERAYQVRDGTMWLTKVELSFDNLRSDRRYQDLLRRMNFPP